MTKQTEALKLALEALEKKADSFGVGLELLNIAAMAAINEALAQPQQEPVGDEWMPCMKLPVVVHVRKQRPGEAHVSTREGITPVKPDDLIMRGVSGEEYPIGRAIFEQTYSLETSPPAHSSWVGLTFAEICECENDYLHIFARAIEAKLRSKNT